jgi:hypothetical protein
MLDRTCYALFMAKQSKKKKRPTDLNLLAASIVEEATNDNSTDEEPSTKNPAAVALGRLGGLKGGPARAKKLSKKKRSEIAQKAAKARWGKL